MSTPSVAIFEPAVCCSGAEATRFSCSDLQIFAASLIIICLFGDAARFRCGISCPKFIFFCRSPCDRSIKRSGMEKPSKIAPAKGKLGVLLPGMGAVSTTFMAGVELVRKGQSLPVGSLTQMGTVRLGKRTEGRSPLIKKLVPLADL